MNTLRKFRTACVAVVLAMPLGRALGQAAYTIGGNVTGLNGTNTVGLELIQPDLPNHPSLSSGNGNFQFTTSYGGGWWVRVYMQPSGQICSKANASGKSLSGNVENVAITCASNHVNQPPELCFYTPSASCSTYGQGSFGTYLEDTQVFQLKNKQGGGAIPFDAADPDSDPGIVATTITLSSPNCTPGTQCSLAFPNDSTGAVSSAQPGVYTINAPMGDTDYILSSMALGISGVTQAIGTVTLTISDNGFNGACSSTDPAPCSKYATAVLYFDAYSAGTLPDRIFLDGFEKR